MKRKLLKALAYVLFLFVLQEGLLRFFFPFPEISNFNRVDYIIGDIPGQGRSYARNIDLVMRSYPDTVADFVNRLNLYGFRDDDWEVAKPRDRKRIVFIGDSFVEGNMARDEETIPRSFERRARAIGERHQVMNFGISSGDWITYSRLVSHVGALFHPDEIILVLFANDVLRRHDFEPDPPPIPLEYDRLRPRILDVLELIQNRETVPFRWNLRKVFFTWNSPETDVPADSELQELVQPEIGAAIRNRDFNSGLIDWPLSAAGFLREPYDPRRTLRAMQETARRNGARLHLAYIPLRNQVTNYYHQFEREFCLRCPARVDLTGEAFQVHRRILAAATEELGIPFLDLSEAIQTEEYRGNHLYWNYDVHMRAVGYQRVGEWLYDWWIARDRAGGQPPSSARNDG
jgi:lysophospholipase L1-like esterase